ncbi:orotidine-5'-phosphate decarboxylase [Nonomuraea sp. NPDC050691]|uniref:orotidine-5'-phosphate decarboxylase n=1 Tax=Nonomuraea sp. NPDC050691 TaxID=3155661 RepID=UPI0033EB47BB
MSIPVEDRLQDRLCLALDTLDRDEIVGTVDELKDLVGYFKIHTGFVMHGPDLVREILGRGVKVFLDLKLYDIPNTLAGYGEAVTRLGVHLVTVDPSGGVEMMRSVVAAADRTAGESGARRPRFVGVTLLTSADQQMLNTEMNIAGSVEEEVRRRALLAAEAGLDGIVCAPGEIGSVRAELPGDFFYVTPGARAAGGSGHDHRRIGTPAEAIADGSSLIVVGRRIRDAADRRKAAQEVLDEIAGAWPAAPGRVTPGR